MNEPQPTEKIKERFQSELKEKFNETKFDEDVKSGKNISLNNLDEYKKEEEERLEFLPKKKNKDKNQMSNGRGLSFTAGFENGEYLAIGSNGHIIKSKNIDDFHRQLAKVFKLNAMKNGGEAVCTLHIGEKAKNKKQFAESFARNFINAGVVVKGDIPKSPEFWNKMKADYLAQEGHNLENWNRLTRFVPKEYMSENEKSVQSQKTPQRTISPTMVSRARTGR